MTYLHISKDDIPTLDGKVAIVTGGCSGIGLATAQILAERGASVHCLDLYPIPSDHPLPAYPTGAITQHVPCNITQWARLCQVFAEIGRADIVVANAGVSQETDYFADSFDPDGQLEEPRYGVIEVNYRATLNVMKLALHAFREAGGGSLVLTSSATAYAPEQSLPVYSATKLALIGLVRALRPSLPLSNVTINAVAPAATITKLLPADLAAPIMAAGAPVSTAHHVGLAVAYSATATQEHQVEGYGRDSEAKINASSRWNGRVILTLGDRWTELEEPIARLKPQWMGEWNAEMTAFQQGLTDMREHGDGPNEEKRE